MSRNVEYFLCLSTLFSVVFYTDRPIKAILFQNCFFLMFLFVACLPHSDISRLAFQPTRPRTDSQLRMIATCCNYRSQETQGSLEIILFYNIHPYFWLYPINTTEWHNFTRQDEAIGNKTLCWAGLDI